MTEQDEKYEDVPEGVDPMTGEVTEPDEEPDVPLEEPEPDEEEEAHAARDDVEIEAIYKKLDTRAANYIKSAGEIMEGGGVPVVLCELCSDAYPGMRWTEPRDGLHAALVSVALEQEQGAPLLEDKDAQICDQCNGYGIVKLPSHVPGNEMRTCRRCNGAGYLDNHPQSGTPIAPAPLAENGATEPMAGVPVHDPAVADLVARGYTVVPPMRPVEVPS